MALLVAARTRDGVVGPSDRKESVQGSPGNEVTKYHLDAAVGFYIALAGDGTAARHLLSRIKRRQISAADIFREIDSLAAESHAALQKTWQVAGHLIVAKSGRIEVYSVSIVSGIAVFLPSDDALRLEGDYGAMVLCRNFARDVALAGMRSETAAKCLHTIAGRIAETVDSVGERGKYGMDMVVLAGAGAVARPAGRRQDGRA